MKALILGILLIGMLLTLPIVAAGQKSSAPNQTQLEQMAARFAPTPMRVDISRLSQGDRQALSKLVEAARIIDDVFMKQYWSGDLELYQKLKKDRSPLGQARSGFSERRRYAATLWFHWAGGLVHVPHPAPRLAGPD